MSPRALALLSVVVVLMVTNPTLLSGQVTPESLKGERVEITYQSAGTYVVTGLLHDVLDHAFLVAPVAGHVVPVPRDQVTGLRFVAGRERRWKKGLGVGAGIGAAWGTLVYLVLDEAFGGSGNTSPGVLAYTAVGALYGAGIGAGIGYFFKRDRWDSVPLPHTMPAGSSMFGDRVDLGISLPLRW